VSFIQFDNDVIAMSEKWYNSNFGMVVGSQFPMSRKNMQLIWGVETEKRIIEEVEKSLAKTQNIHEKHGFSSTDNVKASWLSAVKFLYRRISLKHLDEDVDLFFKLCTMAPQMNLLQIIKDHPSIPGTEKNAFLAAVSQAKELFNQKDN
jgi:hypothetical protein